MDKAPAICACLDCEQAMERAMKYYCEMISNGECGVAVAGMAAAFWHMARLTATRQPLDGQILMHNSMRSVYDDIEHAPKFTVARMEEMLREAVDRREAALKAEAELDKSNHPVDNRRKQ